MRKSKWWMLVAVAAMALAAQAFAQGVRVPTPGSGSKPGSGGGLRSRESVSDQTLAALAAIGTSDRTIAGPGTMRQPGGDDVAHVYRVQSGTVPDVCITVLNVGSSAPVRIVVPNEPETGSAIPGATVTRCFAAPALIDLRCADNEVCDAVWRVDATN